MFILLFNLVFGSYIAYQEFPPAVGMGQDKIQAERHIQMLVNFMKDQAFNSLAKFDTAHWNDYTFYRGELNIFCVPGILDDISTNIVNLQESYDSIFDRTGKRKNSLPANTYPVGKTYSSQTATGQLTPPRPGNLTGSPVQQLDLSQIPEWKIAHTHVTKAQSEQKKFSQSERLKNELLDPTVDAVGNLRRTAEEAIQEYKKYKEYDFGPYPPTRKIEEKLTQIPNILGKLSEKKKYRTHPPSSNHPHYYDALDSYNAQQKRWEKEREQILPQEVKNQGWSIEDAEKAVLNYQLELRREYDKSTTERNIWKQEQKMEFDRKQPELRQKAELAIAAFNWFVPLVNDLLEKYDKNKNHSKLKELKLP